MISLGCCGARERMVERVDNGHHDDDDGHDAIG